METIVVGVDGSDCARTALGLAAGEAALRGARLRIVSAWDVAPALYAGGFAPGFDQATVDAFRETAEAVVRDALAEASGCSPRSKSNVGRSKDKPPMCSCKRRATRP
jgi:nucleotide-binding universal stress UspA family protein